MKFLLPLILLVAVLFSASKFITVTTDTSSDLKKSIAEKFTVIAPAALAEEGVFIGQNVVGIIDLRLNEAYRLSHIKGSINILPGNILTSLPSLKENYQILIFVSDDVRDEELVARQVADNSSYPKSQLLVLQGGMNAWLDAKYPIESTK